MLIFEFEGKQVEINLPEGNCSVEQAAWESLLEGVGCGSTMSLDYECGGCCKRVWNIGRIIPVFPLGIVILLPPSGPAVQLECMERGSSKKQHFCLLILPICRICSLGFHRGNTNLD